MYNVFMVLQQKRIIDIAFLVEQIFQLNIIYLLHNSELSFILKNVNEMLENETFSSSVIKDHIKS